MGEHAVDLEKEMIEPIVTRLHEDNCEENINKYEEPIVLKGKHRENILSSLLTKGQHLRNAMLKSAIKNQTSNGSEGQIYRYSIYSIQGCK